MLNTRPSWGSSRLLAAGIDVGQVLLHVVRGVVCRIYLNAYWSGAHCDEYCMTSCQSDVDFPRRARNSIVRLNYCGVLLLLAVVAI